MSSFPKSLSAQSLERFPVCLKQHRVTSSQERARGAHGNLELRSEELFGQVSKSASLNLRSSLVRATKRVLYLLDKG
eukprot:5527220-Pleurochrysis_carterae.AAC.1